MTGPIAAPPPDAPRSGRWKLWLALAVLALLGVFLLQNTRVVEVRLLFWKVEMSRAFMVLGVGLASFVAGLLLGTLRRR